MAPEEAFKKICADHNLTVVSAGMNLNQEADYLWSANVHWEGFSRRNLACAGGSGPDMATAILNAINASVIDRTPAPVIDVPAIDVELAA